MQSQPLPRANICKLGPLSIHCNKVLEEYRLEGKKKLNQTRLKPDVLDDDEVVDAEVDKFADNFLNNFDACNEGEDMRELREDYTHCSSAPRTLKSLDIPL